ncbi:MAG: hypothetical protein JNK04_06540 [Myxococcales bacterium]|nr:hypothetical protein [Myxococcales bacterium]
MKRKVIMGLLALGTVGGFASGFASMRCHARNRHDAFERKVADICVRAARDADAEARSGEKGSDRAAVSDR